MQEGITAEWLAAIRMWATDEPLIKEVWAFGSRVKGTYRPDSDLDIALRLVGEDDDERLGTAIFRMEDWHASLQCSLDVQLQLECLHQDDTVVLPAIREHGRLLFCRSD